MSGVVLIDAGGANIGSVRYALQRLGVDAQLSGDAATIRRAQRVILPGVGAAAPAMERLRALDLVDTIRSLTQPLLGICLGMQLLFDESEEGPGRGLGVIPGRVERIRAARIPHIGWNTVDAVAGSALASAPLDVAYFAHSYVCRPRDERVVTAWTTEGGDRFPSAVRAGSATGVQFHPEKSSREGVALLVTLVNEALG